MDHHQRPPAGSFPRSDHSDRFDHCPWLFETEAPKEQRAAQRERQRSLGGDSEVGERCYVAGSAAVFPDLLRLGDDSYIAAHAYVTGTLTTGADCTLNPFTVARGTISLGTGVRIGAHTSLLGFNHSMAPDRPIHRQPQSSQGITIGDDVWIGSHVVVVDGVTIGDHCVIGAGAVVTKDVPAWTVAAGNPARRIRDRRETGGREQAEGRAREGGVAAGRGTGGLVGGDVLARFADTARAQAADILASRWNGDHYTDRPGATPTVRAHCDAVEIADLLLSSVPEQLDRARHIERLVSLQDRETGLVPELGEQPPPWTATASSARARRCTTSCRWATRWISWALPSPNRFAASVT